MTVDRLLPLISRKSDSAIAHADPTSLLPAAKHELRHRNVPWRSNGVAYQKVPVRRVTAQVVRFERVQSATGR
jgi:hypothetical protein